MPTPTDKQEERRRCCDESMVPNGNETGIRCAKKCGYWEARPPYIKVEIVNGHGIYRGKRAVLFDDTRITPMKVSPCEVEESWAIDVEHLLDNPAIASLLASREAEAFERGRDFQDAKVAKMLEREGQQAFNAGKQEGYDERRKEDRGAAKDHGS